MALSSLRLRRALTSLSFLRRSLFATPAFSSSSHHLRTTIFAPAPAARPQSSSLLLLFPSRRFCSSPIAISESNSSDVDDAEINPLDTSFQGCDYNHWLFVINFPQDPKPTPEQMVAKFEEICAKGLNISIEEAKTKIYACSTTSFEGFQAVMSKEEAEKFNDIPEVAFVLADSYLYPETKEYGGDKYVNGQVIRSTQVQHDREGGPMSDGQENPPSNHQRPMRGGRSEGDKDVNGQVVRSTPVQHKSKHPRFNDRDKSPRHNDREGGPLSDRQGNSPSNHQRPMRGVVSKGDKDSNGQVIRSTPVQHESKPPKFNDRDKNHRHSDRERMSDRQGNPPSNHQRPMRGVSSSSVPSQNNGPPVQGDRGGPFPNYRPLQNYGLTGQEDGRGSRFNNCVPQNYGPPVQRGEGGGGPMPSYQNKYNPQQPGHYAREQGGYPQREQWGYAPSGQRDFSGGNHAPVLEANYGRGTSASEQREGRGPMPLYQNYYNQWQTGNYPQEQGDHSQGEQWGYAPSGQLDFSGGNHAPVLEANYGRGTSASEQREGRGPMPLYQNYYNQWQTGNYPQEQGDYSQGEQWGYAPSGWRDFNGSDRNCAPVLEANYGQGPSAPGQREGVSILSYEGNYNQLLPRNSNYPQEQGDYPQREQRGYAPPGPRNSSGGKRNYAPVLEANYGRSAPGQREERTPMHLYEGNYNQWHPGDYPLDQGGIPQKEQRGYAPPEQRDINGGNRNYAPVLESDYGLGPSASGQREGVVPMLSYEGNYNQWQPGNFNYPQKQGNYPQRGYEPPGQSDFGEGNRNHAPMLGVNYGQEPSAHQIKRGQGEGRGPMPSYRDNYNRLQLGNCPQEQGDNPPRGYAPFGQRDLSGVNYGQEPSAHQIKRGQREERGPMPSYQDNYNRLELENYPQEQGDYPQRGYAPSGQRDFSVDNRNYAPMQGVNYGQGPNGLETDGSQTHQMFSQVEQRKN